MSLRALIVAFDGLQPAQVTADLTPNIHALSRRGVTFTRHHAVFPTVTRVNAASMVTGRRPGGHGLAGNTLVMRDFDPARVIPAMAPELRQVAEATGGRVLHAPTIGEVMAQHGMRWVSIVGGTSGNAYVQHPRAATVGGAVIHHEFSLPGGLHQDVVRRFGAWPRKASPALGKVGRVADVLLDYVLPELQPEAAMLWFPEPDTSQHATAVGSETTCMALAEADRQLGRIMDRLKQDGQTPDVFVISDHGYSTTSAVVDVEGMTRDAGFTPRDVLVAPNGGAALFYVRDSERDMIDRLAGWLAGQEWAGALVAGNPEHGRLGLLAGDAAGVAGPRAPDIIASMSWDTEPGANGFAGTSFATGGAIGQGSHGSGSPQEFRNVLVASGPGFKQGIASDVPSGNVDLALTVLHVLGLSAGVGTEGRILSEALVTGRDSALVEHNTMDICNERTYAGGRRLSQRMRVRSVCNTRYIEGLYAERSG